MELRDEEALAGFVHGDLSQFEGLVRRYERPLLGFIYRYLGDRARSEELAQEAFLRVFRHAARFDPSLSFRAWLYTIALNLCRHEAKRRGSETEWRRRQAVGEPAATDDSPVALAQREEAMEAVRGAVAVLPDEQRAVLVMRVYQGLSYEEIASVIGCPVGTAKSRMFYALERVRVQLGERLPTGAPAPKPRAL